MESEQAEIGRAARGRGFAVAEALRDKLNAFLALIEAELVHQAPRAFVWIVVAFAAGIVAFFTWTNDPPPYAGLLVAICGAALWPLARRFRMMVLAN